MTRRTFTYAAVWAVLTVLAAAVVWWGLGPLLAPIMQSAASPPQFTPRPADPPSPSPSQVSPTPVVSPSSATPRPRPSMFEGWQFAGGVFTQTFTLGGGRASLRIEGGRVSLVSSQAANGYTITPRQPSQDRLVVEFFDGTHFFVLDTMWWESKPYAKVTQVS